MPKYKVHVLYHRSQIHSSPRSDERAESAQLNVQHDSQTHCITLNINYIKCINNWTNCLHRFIKSDF